MCSVETTSKESCVINSSGHSGHVGKLSHNALLHSLARHVKVALITLTEPDVSLLLWK